MIITYHCSAFCSVSLGTFFITFITEYSQTFPKIRKTHKKSNTFSIFALTFGNDLSCLVCLPMFFTPTADNQALTETWMLYGTGRALKRHPARIFFIKKCVDLCGADMYIVHITIITFSLITLCFFTNRRTGLPAAKNSLTRKNLSSVFPGTWSPNPMRIPERT